MTDVTNEETSVDSCCAREDAPVLQDMAPAPAPAPTFDSHELDFAVSTVAARKEEWARCTALYRAAMLREMIPTTVEAAEGWVRDACIAKGIDFDSATSGEEWLGGPAVVVRNLRLLAESYDDLSAGSLPHERLKTRERVDGLREIDVFPASGLDAALFAKFSCTVLVEPDAAQSGPEIPKGGMTCLVLGAGNVSSIPAMDVLYKCFVEGRVCVLKMNPVNAYVGPHIEKAFAPLIRRGYLRVVYGGADVGKYLCEHEAVDEIHITGSDKTHDLIVWGPTDGQAARKAANDPLVKKPVTSELGNVSPVLITPGEYSPKELQFMAKNVAAMVANNASFNCNAAKMLVTAACWKQRAEFLKLLKDTLAATPTRKAYYPGAQQRYNDLIAGRRVTVAGKGDSETLPWALITGLNPLDSNDKLFCTEPFCGLLSEVTIPCNNATSFLREATRFCNESLWGTLNASVMIDPRTEKSSEGKAALTAAVEGLNYGSVAINHWPALGYGFVSPPWGAAPGHTLADVKSGIGWVHNTFMLRKVVKSVIRGPLVVSPKPAWFTDNAVSHVIGRKLVAFEADPSAFKVPGIALTALKG
jgi:aldehyde dehydrogenase (NAD(P)+)